MCAPWHRVRHTDFHSWSGGASWIQDLVGSFDVHGIGIRRDRGHGIGGYVDLMVLAWWGGVDLWDGRCFFLHGLGSLGGSCALEAGGWIWGGV